MIRKLSRRPVLGLVIGFFITLNLAIGAQAGAAGLQDGLCQDDEGGELVECCTFCLFFCHCSIID